MSMLRTVASGFNMGSPQIVDEATPDLPRYAETNQSFGYDALDELIRASGGCGTIGYTYNTLGNRSGASSVVDATTPLVSMKTGGVTTSHTYCPSGSL